VGGEEKLKKVDVVTWKSKVDITFNDNTNHFTSHATLRGLDHYRSEVEGELGGNPFKGVTVLSFVETWIPEMGLVLDRGQGQPATKHAGHTLTEDASAARRALCHAASTSSRSSLTRTFVEAASRTASA